jgi:sialic acid synthase SpsE
VYDNEDVSVLQSMKVEWFKIPSVFTYNYKGKEIIELIRCKATNIGLQIFAISII